MNRLVAAVVGWMHTEMELVDKLQQIHNHNNNGMYTDLLPSLGSIVVLYNALFY